MLGCITKGKTEKIATYSNISENVGDKEESTEKHLLFPQYLKKCVGVGGDPWFSVMFAIRSYFLRLHRFK